MIRPTQPSDIDALVDLTRATNMFKPLEVKALREVLDDYFAENKELGHICVTYEHDQDVLGFTYYGPAEMTENTWQLWWIAVRKGAQGGGIGKQLLLHAEDDIRRRRGRVLFIETGSLPHYEPTRRFYVKNGYEQHAMLKDFYAAGDSMVVFRKEL